MVNKFNLIKIASKDSQKEVQIMLLKRLIRLLFLDFFLEKKNYRIKYEIFKFRNL